MGQDKLWYIYIIEYDSATKSNNNIDDSQSNYAV